MLESQIYQCPYCWEEVEALLICRPVIRSMSRTVRCAVGRSFSLQTDGENWSLDVRGEND